ncbi:MAG: hypothetical protein RR323_04085 [Raoultibacter sp.]
MKTCPICKARCFDDMEICYGCMHQFELAQPTPPAATFTEDEAPQPTAPLCPVADPFEEREEATAAPAPTSAEAPTPTPTPTPAEASTAAPTTFLTPPFSLEDLFIGQEYRLEITLHPCKKEHASAQRRSSCTDEL